MVAIVGTDAGKIKEVVCHNCASCLQYTPSEEKKDYSTDYTGGKDYFRYIKCPSCNKKVVTRHGYY